MRLPLEHVKVIDLTQVWAGPFSTQMLAAMGAEVIHVESQHRPDLARTFDIQDVPTHIPEDRSPYFNQHNRKKKAISLDLSSEKGREIFLRMIPNVDCVINNFSRRVLPNWGFTYERLSAINPGIIMLGMPSHGATGPQADYVCFGEALEGATGLVAPRGYVQGEPLRSGAAYPDPAGGLVAASALLAGLAYRRRTGKGMNFDMSQRDCSIRLMGEAFLGYGMNGEEPSQLNNAHPHWAPHRAYRAAGDDQWLTVACANDEQWRALATAIGRPELATDPRFASGLARLHNREELDAILAAWAKDQDAPAAKLMLMRAGVPAGEVLTVGTATEDPHLQARDMYPMMDHPVIGPHFSFAMPQKFIRTPTRPGGRAPLFSEHTHELVTELAGVGEQEYEELRAAEVIDAHPTGLDLR